MAGFDVVHCPKECPVAEIVLLSNASQPEHFLFKVPSAVQVAAFSVYHSPKEWVCPAEGNLAITDVSFAVQPLFLQLLVFVPVLSSVALTVTFHSVQACPVAVIAVISVFAEHFVQ